MVIYSYVYVYLYTNARILGVRLLLAIFPCGLVCILNERDNTRKNVLALNNANSGSILATAYGPPKTSRSNP